MIFLLERIDIVMITKNYHTHTKRCGHAEGEDEEYVQNAIQAGIKVLGFSDHVPYVKPEPRDRMNISQADDYIKSITQLRDKYKDQIEIHLGMEVEYYPTEWNTLSQFRKELEYCILGQHSLSYYGQSSYELSTLDQLNEYTDLLYEACKHGLCDYIAHPDLIMWSYPYEDESVKAIAKRIAEISIKFSMPLELNCGSGVRVGIKEYSSGARYPYPTRIFFEEFAKQNCPMIIGLDIHKPERFLMDVYVERALSIVDGLNIHFLNDDPSFDLIEEAKKRKKLFY